MKNLSINSKSNGSSYIYEPYRFNEGDCLIVRIMGKKIVEMANGNSFVVVQGIDLLTNRRLSFSNQVFIKNFHLINERIIRIVCTEVEQKVIDGKDVFVPQIELDGIELSLSNDGNSLIIND